MHKSIEYSCQRRWQANYSSISCISNLKKSDCMFTIPTQLCMGFTNKIAPQVSKGILCSEHEFGFKNFPSSFEKKGLETLKNGVLAIFEKL